MDVLEKNVQDFLNKSSEIIGSFEHDMFGLNMVSNFQDLKIASPIEKIFYVAFHVLMKINYQRDLEPVGPNDQHLLGVGINPQTKIGNYRVDFLTSYYLFDKIKREAIVECDGHDFHDSNEQERRQEKQRDRFLQSKGYRIFHFTGSEINQKPFYCAAEVLAFLLDQQIENTIDFNYLPEE